MPSYTEIQDKLKSEFDFWCSKRSDNYYKLGYSTGYDGMFAKGEKPTMPDATLAYGDLGKLSTWWSTYAGGIVKTWADAQKNVTQNASFSFPGAQDFVVVTKDKDGNRTSGFNFHITYAPVPPPAPITATAPVTTTGGPTIPVPVVKFTFNVKAPAYVPGGKIT